MDAIFKALNDPVRRALLDSLRKKDGQSLSDLEEQIEMTRFGVMKHLRVLEDASLVVTRKVGRFKYHYLNAAPLQEVSDRWIEPLLSMPTAQAATMRKAQLEEDTDRPAAIAEPDVVMSTFVNCSHDALWEALIKGNLMEQYHFVSNRVAGDLNTAGGEAVFRTPDGRAILKNRVLAIDPKSRIELEFEPYWSEDRATSRCVYLVQPEESGVKLTVEHYGIPEGQEGVADGWARHVAGLKTWLETGDGHRFSYQAARA